MNDNFSYSMVKISKKNGKYRKVYIPNEAYLRQLIPELQKIYKQNVIFESDHGFVPNRNCVTNASVHIEHRYVLTIDIEDFFDSVNYRVISKYIPIALLKDIIIDNRVPQGFPTSPIVANIAMIDIDKLIIESLERRNPNIKYSRYADDLTFSFDNVKEKELIFSEVTKVFRGFGLKLNSKKTKLQDKNNGRAIITGIGVSYHTVHPTRNSLKKLRSAIHQKNENSVIGLREWVLCKYPKTEILHS
tara:strand:- start:494 stop:1231 length:738 start_codon:yes stop_codon:yes gene_type:complete